MAFSPAQSITDSRSGESQESMFESAAEFPGHDRVELPDQSESQEEYGSFEDFEASPEFEALPEAGEPRIPQESWGASLEETRHTQSGSPSMTLPSMASPGYPNPDPDPAPEPNPLPDPEPHPDSPNLPLTIADFSALEDRVLRAVSLVRRERQSRTTAEERAGFAEGRALAAEARAVALEEELRQFHEQSPAVDQLLVEVDALRQEREQVRQRVERLLGQLDALEL